MLIYPSGTLAGEVSRQQSADDKWGTNIRLSARPCFVGTEMKNYRVVHLLRWITELCYHKKAELPVAGRSHTIGFAIAPKSRLSV